MDKISKIMSRKVKTISKNDSIVKAARLMFKGNVSCVVVIEKRKPIGLVSERDLAVRVLDKNKNINELKVVDIMTAPILTVSSDTDVYYASEIMRKNKIKKLPIVNKGNLAGIVTQTDILNYFRDQRKKFVLKSLKFKDRKNYPFVWEYFL